MSDTALGPSPKEPRRRRSTSAAQALANAKAATGRTKVGRPLTYSPALCDRAIALGMQGKHWSAIATAFNISRNTLHQWAEQYPPFKDALIRARTASQAWWEGKVQQKLGAKHFQANAARLVMSGNFKEDYAERGSVGLADALPDFLAAITEAADRRRQKALEARDGSQAKAVEPQDVALEPSDKSRQGPR